jgi:hypothetical protein
MKTRRMLALVTVVGGAVAGCATGTGGPDDPIALEKMVDCFEAAELLAVDVGAHELTIEAPTPGVHPLEAEGPFAITLYPRGPRGLLVQAPPEVHAVIVDRTRELRADSIEYVSAEIGELAAEIYLHEPEVPGPFEFTVYPHSKGPRGFALRVCWDR